MELLEYWNEQISSIRVNSGASGRTDDAEFLDWAVDQLDTMGELPEPVIEYFGQNWKGNRKIRVDGYAENDADQTLNLFVCIFSNDNEPLRLTNEILEPAFAQMKNMLAAVEDQSLKDYCDVSNPYVNIAMDWRNRMHMRYTNDNQQDISIRKVRLIVISNGVLAVRSARSVQEEEWNNLRIERQVWSLERFFELEQSGREKEAVEFKFSDFGYKGIPCLKAELQNTADYDAYIAIFPADALVSVYEKYGSRLLEGNVRAFLSIRGKVNKGIRETILKEPSKFFTYNNGISCTADSLELEHDENGQLLITGLRDLQIINGGQTTASLQSAKQRDSASLDGIFVQAKITIIKDKEAYGDMVQRIARYANSQNSVKKSDFFANHEFHRTFERLSKSIAAPIASGSLRATYWYYERSRGKYEQEMFKMSKSQRDKYQETHPKKQVVTKEKLAQYYNTIHLKPYAVALGQVKNMDSFATTIDKLYEKDSSFVNADFYEEMIAAGILWETARTTLLKSDFFVVKGITTAVVPYAIAKVVASCPKDKTIDWKQIWKKQAVPSAVMEQVYVALKDAYDFIVKEGAVGVISEYGKRQTSWEKYEKRPFSLNPDFVKSLVSKELLEEQKYSAAKSEKQNKEINVEVEIYRLGAPYWRKLRDEAIERGLVGPEDSMLLKIVCSFDGPRPMMLNQIQAKKVWKMRERFAAAGVLVD